MKEQRGRLRIYAPKVKQRNVNKVHVKLPFAEISVQYIYSNNCIIRLLPFLYRSIAYGEGLNNNNELVYKSHDVFYSLQYNFCRMLYYIIMT